MGFNYTFLQQTFSNNKLTVKFYVLGQWNHRGQLSLEVGIKTQIFPALSYDKFFQSKIFSLWIHIFHIM